MTCNSMQALQTTPSCNLRIATGVDCNARVVVIVKRQPGMFHEQAGGAGRGVGLRSRDNLEARGPGEGDLRGAKPNIQTSECHLPPRQLRRASICDTRFASGGPQ